MHAEQVIVLVLGMVALPLGAGLVWLGRRWRQRMLDDPRFPQEDITFRLSYFGQARFCIISGYGISVLGACLSIGAVIGAIFWK